MCQSLFIVIQYGHVYCGEVDPGKTDECNEAAGALVGLQGG